MHVHGPGSDDLKEEERPVSGPLRTALHGVKHPAHLAQTEREDPALGSRANTFSFIKTNANKKKINREGEGTQV